MSKQTNIIIGILVIVVVAGALIFQLSRKETNSIEQPQAEIPTTQTDTAASVSTEGDKSDVSVPGSYTLIEVAKHATKTDCWTAVNGSVYNVTSWITKHPGGQEEILSLCGKDGSAAFNGQHGGQAQQEKQLASFKIGTLSN